MRSYQRILRGFFVLGLASFTCWSCAASGTVGKGATAESPAGEIGQQKSPSAQGVARRTDNLLGIQIQDQGSETYIRMTGNGPFQDYQFRRLGDDQFAVELQDLKSVPNLPSLPTSSARVRLIYADGKQADGVQIIGSLKSPLDRYVLNNVGNDLLLTLYFQNEEQSAPGAAASSGAYESFSASGKESTGQTSRTSQRAAPTKKAKKDKSKPARVVAARANPEPADDPPAAVDSPSVAGFAKQYVGKPISLDLVDADLRNVLRLISDLTGTNMVIEPDVAGRVTLKVERVPWDQVLDMVLAMNGLGKEQVGNVIRIAKQAKLKQEWNLAADEIKAKQELLEIAKDVGEISTVYLAVNYAQPADIAGKINENKSEKGKVATDDRSSLVIYSDFPARIENARRLLARLDRPTPQVLIEARIVTASSDVTRSLGITWNINALAGAARTGLPDFARAFQVAIPAAIPFGFTLAETINNTLMNVDLQLAAQEIANQVNVLAAPKVLTLNHVKATINQGSQIPYLKLSDLNVASTEFKDAVLELQVTPHITPDRKIRLEIQAKQDEPGATNFQVGQSVVPGIDTRKINTELLVDDGNIVVIGGVLRRTDTDSRTATPGLWKIPVLGRLFRSDTNRVQRLELIILISPKIVESSGPIVKG